MLLRSLQKCHSLPLQICFCTSLNKFVVNFKNVRFNAAFYAFYILSQSQGCSHHSMSANAKVHLFALFLTDSTKKSNLKPFNKFVSKYNAGLSVAWTEALQGEVLAAKICCISNDILVFFAFPSMNFHPVNFINFFTERIWINVLWL